MKAQDTSISAPTPAPATGIVWTAEQEIERQKLAHEQAMQLQRETTARWITFGMLGGFGAMLLVTYALLAFASDPVYSRAKDLLLFINPLVGVVIGYYFNKVTTEVRAEKAEAAAQTANATAQSAEGEKRVAEQKANQADTQASEAVGALKDLADATKDGLGEPAAMRAKTVSRSAAIESGADPDEIGSDNPALARALAKAEQVLARAK